jgi:hypothetical protein
MLVLKILKMTDSSSHSHSHSHNHHSHQNHSTPNNSSKTMFDDDNDDDAVQGWLCNLLKFPSSITPIISIIYNFRNESL